MAKKKKIICEMCGRSTDTLYKISIEGTILNVCPYCKKYGVPIDKKEKKTLETKIQKDFQRDIIETVIDNYNEILRKWREDNNKTQEEMAKLLGIKVSLYRSIEEGKIVPDINLAKRIEKILKVKLITKEAIFSSEDINDIEEGILVKDIIDIKFE